MLSRDSCPAGRARCARGGHFVACVPVWVSRSVWVRPLAGLLFFELGALAAEDLAWEF